MDKTLKTSNSGINFNIRIKLRLSFLAVILLAFLVGGVGYYGVHKIDLEANDLGNHWLKATNALSQVLEDTEDIQRTLLLGFIERTDASAYQSIKFSFTTYRTKWEKDFATYTNYVTTGEGKTRNEALQKSFAAYMTDAEQVWKLIEEQKDAEASSVLTDKSKVSFDQLLTDMEAQMSFMDQGGAQAVADAQATDGSVLKLLIVIVILALVGGIVLALVLARNISRPLAKVTQVAQRVAAGDLDIEMPAIKNKDEIGFLSQAVSEMLHSLRDIIGEVLTQSANVATTSESLTAAAEEATAASEQVSGTLAQLAAGATDQAAAVKDAGAVMEQMFSSAQQVAANAEIVNQSSEKAARAAGVGLVQAENAVQKIQHLREASEQAAAAVFQLEEQSGQIGQIVDVIRNLAEQTNLLALNAAIEAARAGEQGKGFAVVAEEVRKLAEQSSLSTAQIAELIGNIQRETKRAVEIMEKGKGDVEAGVEAVNLAGHSFKTIGEEVNTVAEQIQQVTSVAQQMASGTVQAVQVVRNIGSIAEQAALSTEEVSTASEEQAATMASVSEAAEALAGFGDGLALLVGKFKV